VALQQKTPWPRACACQAAKSLDDSNQEVPAVFFLLAIGQKRPLADKFHFYGRRVVALVAEVSSII
jgi:hypothetical protein